MEDQHHPCLISRESSILTLGGGSVVPWREAGVRSEVTVQGGSSYAERGSEEDGQHAAAGTVMEEDGIPPG